MVLFRALFGHPLIEEWKEAAAKLGAEFSEEGFGNGNLIRYQYGPWEMILDSHLPFSNNDVHRHSRVRVLWLADTETYLRVTPAGLLSGFNTWLGAQDLQIGDAEFDRDFVIKGNDAEKARLFFQDESLKQLIRALSGFSQMSFESHIYYAENNPFRDRDLFVQLYPDKPYLHFHELVFDCYGIVREFDNIKRMFDLCATALDHLTVLGYTNQEPLPLRIETK